MIHVKVLFFVLVLDRQSFRFKVYGLWKMLSPGFFHLYLCVLAVSELVKGDLYGLLFILDPVHCPNKNSKNTASIFLA